MLDPPVFIQEAYHTCTLSLGICVLSIDLASLRHLPGVILPANGIHPAKSRMLYPLQLCLALFVELPYNALGLLVKSIVRSIFQLG